MTVTIKTARPLRWHVELARRLEAGGHRVHWVAGCPGPALPTAIHLLFELDALVYRRRGARLWAEAAPPRGAGATLDGVSEVTLDLTGADSPPGTALRVLHDGVPDVAAAVAALVDGRTPWLEVVDARGTLCAGLPASEAPSVISAGLDAVLARAIDLCLRAVASADAGDATEPPPAASLRPLGTRASAGRVAAFSLGQLGGKVLGLLRRRLRQGEIWRVGVRAFEGATILEAGRVHAQGFRWLVDDGARFYADPCMFEHRGRTWMFVEDYPFATRKGVISVCEILPDGRFGPVRPVIEEAVHLSYPHVFAWRGEIWMMPESSMAGELVLYRATAFPFSWRRERVLVDGLELADATLFHHDGRAWIFAATTGAAGGSSWDALSLFHAPDLDGTFVPHALNPVLVDVRAARPAGRLMRRKGKLLRTAQNCADGYGSSIAVAEVQRLDLEGYRQAVTGELKAPAAWGASGLHTLDAVGGFEAIDILSARAPDASDA